MFNIDISEVVKLYLGGFTIGIIVSVIPLIVGVIINFAYNIVKGGH